MAHHGSDTSTTAEFLSVVNPQLAVISVGDGKPFGHPDNTSGLSWDLLSGGGRVSSEDRSEPWLRKYSPSMLLNHLTSCREFVPIVET